MTAYATHDDVKSRWIGEAVPSNALIDAYIADASTMIRFEFPDIDDRIGSEDPGGVPAELVKLVVVRVVTRVLRNPDNVKTAGTGPFTTTYASDNPGEFSLTSDERAMLSGLAATGGQRGFTIDPTPQTPAGYIGVSDEWAELWA